MRKFTTLTLLLFSAILAASPASAQDNSTGEETPYSMADIKPEFMGDFREWLAKSISYPQAAINNNVDGRVAASFIIEQDGSLSDISILASPHEKLSIEVLAVLAKSPAWTPGMTKDSVKLRVRYEVPVDFALPEQEEGVEKEYEIEPGFEYDSLTFKEWLRSNIVYPSEQIANKAEGVCVVLFDVEESGSVRNIEILGNPHPALSDEVVQAVYRSPEWIPGKAVDGTQVKVRMVVSVAFKSDGNNGDISVTTPFTEKRIIAEINKSNQRDYIAPVFIVDEEEIDFIGWVHKNIIFPPEDLIPGNEGRVHLNYIIDKQGRATNIIITGSPSEAFSSEVKRVMTSAPKHTPAMKQGERVNTNYNTYINFVIETKRL